MSSFIINPDVTLRNIDIQETLARIATINIYQFYSRDQVSDDYTHLFVEYFENVYLQDVDSFFIPMLLNSSSSDIDVFFIKCSFYMKGSKAHKKYLLSRLFDDIVKHVGEFLYEENLYRPDSEFLKAINVILFDFLGAIDLSDYFTGLKNRHEEGLFSSQPVLQAPNKKLKVDLSVPQLVLLFRLLNELKPNIFEIKYQEDLVGFIVSNFETKGSASLKEDSVRNKFSEFNQNARDFWLKHISTLQKFLLDYKEN